MQKTDDIAMTPYYKLANHWTKDASQFVIFGPHGLVLTELIQKIQKQYPYMTKRIQLQDQADCQDLKAKLATQSLFSEPELIIINAPTDALLKHLSLPKYTQSERIIIILGPEKPSKLKWLAEFGLNIRTYALKEPYKSRAINKILQDKNIQISSKALKWISLSHQGHEDLIPMTIERIRLTFDQKQINDEQIRSILFNQSSLTVFEAIDAMCQSSLQLKMFYKTTRREDWSKVYWTLVSYWRKIARCSMRASEIKEHFPWEKQSKQATFILQRIPTEAILNYHQELLKMESSLKGLNQNPYIISLQKWMIQVQKELI